MKLIRYRHTNRIRRGALVGDAIFSLGRRHGHPVLGDRLCGLDEAVLLPPVVPTKVIAVALNYRDGREEPGLRPPSDPLIFLKPPSSVIGPLDPIIYPSQSSRLDYEAELAVVVASRAHGVPPARAKDFILGYTCGNDVTARDLQKDDWPLALCKSFDSFCPLGPVVETEVDPSALEIQLRLNGQVRQSSSTAKMHFSPVDLLSYVSSVMTLEPGDIILTGSPAGVGPMEIGDVVEVEIAGIGVLRNHVVAAAPPTDLSHG